MGVPEHIASDCFKGHKDKASCSSWGLGGLKEQAVQPFSKLVTVVAESEARRENAKVAVQKTQHVDFAYLLKLAMDFEIVLVSQVQAELERDPSSV